MTSKSIKVTLGGKHYAVPKLNIGQLREVTRLFKNDADGISFDVLALALQRAEPKVEDAEAIEAEIDEVTSAVNQILVHSGFKKDEQVPNEKAPSTAG